MLTQILWIALAAAVLHVLEEVWAGFLAWYRTVLPRFGFAVNIPWFTAVNTLMVSYGLLAVNWHHGPMVIRLGFPALLLINALIHLSIAFYRRGYNPGLLTAILLYLPISFFSVRAAVLQGASQETILFAFLVGIGVHALLPVSLLISQRLSLSTASDRGNG